MNGICDDVIADYFWARAVVLTSPTVATIGMSITIPLAMISDSLLGKEQPSALSACGALLVVFGFVVLNTQDQLWASIIRQGFSAVTFRCQCSPSSQPTMLDETLSTTDFAIPPIGANDHDPIAATSSAEIAI